MILEYIENDVVTVAWLGMAFSHQHGVRLAFRSFFHCFSHE